MCKDCKKEKLCRVACASLMRVPKKDLTSEEFKRVCSYELMAGDQSGY